MEDNNTKSHSVLLYNTQNIDSQLLKAGFSIRKKEYQRIWKDIKKGSMEKPETHYLIQGVRGAGKTTLLSRLANEVGEDEELNSWLIPILLNEEEYGILSLFTFWLRITEKLAEQNADKYTALFEQVSSLNDSAEIAWELIQSHLDKNKQKMIVFVDNLGELFKDFDDIEHAQLREVLSLHPQIRLIGGSSQLLEAHFDGAAPFYQFFKLVNLKPINEAEMHELLRSLAKQTNAEAVKTIEEIITKHPERIEAVRRLTDGVPRTIVLLFQIIMEGAKESSYAYLEETIDKTTPLYKHRMDDLSRQQKAIVHTIAMNWDALSTKEIAEQTRLPSKTVSAQLVKLQQQWIVDKIETSTKNHLYIIKERFFNIWYLMRYGSQADKRRVLWLTRFLESWNSEQELMERFYEFDSFITNQKETVSQDYINALLASNKIPYTLKAHYSRELKQKYPETIEIDSKEYENIGDIIHYISELRSKGLFYKSVDVALWQAQSNDVQNIILAALYLRIVLSEDFSKSDELFDRAEDLIEIKGYKSKDVKDLAFYSYLQGICNRKMKVLKVIEKFLEEEDSKELLILLAIFQVWNDIYDKSLINFNIVIEDIHDRVLHFDYIQEYLLMLLAKEQVESTYNILNDTILREKYKPIYYATVSLLQDERQQEYLRMGPELQGTVYEILQKVEDFRVKYA